MQSHESLQPDAPLIGSVLRKDMILRAAFRPLALFVIIVGVAGCANPLNRATYDRYWQQGGDAERAGELTVAERAYYRALVNVDMGNLGPLLKAQGLYNLGRIKRRVGKYAVGEDLLKQSLALDEGLLTPDNLDTDRCRIELSVVLAAQGKWEEGSRYLERILPRAARFTGQERQFLSEVLKHFTIELRKIGNGERARLFDQELG